MDQLQFIKKGSCIKDLFDDLALLRIEVFKDFPYLYEGSVAYEKEYLATYTQSEHSFLFAVYHMDKMIGATTCIPLSDETAEIKLPVEKAAYDISRIFYFGESILLPQFRGRGLGHRFFDEREAHAQSLKEYQKALFFSVQREPDHPLKPENYRANDDFWLKRGYRKQADLEAVLKWPDVGTTESTSKTLVGWMKDL